MHGVRASLRAAFGIAIVAIALPLSGASGAAESATEGNTATWRTVSVGRSHTCAISTSRRLYCWGDDDHGQLGDGGTNSDQPTPVAVGFATNWTAVTAGADHTCARRSTGRLFCWGRDDEGQVGNGVPFGDQITPAQVAGNRTDWTAFSAGGAHTCARRSTGRLFCWGRDDDGQLGDGAVRTDRAAPSPVSGSATWGGGLPLPARFVGTATSWRSVSAGTNHTCGRKASGRLFCWGSDDDGQLGDGAAYGPDQPIPAVVGSGMDNITDWTGVSAGGSHSCGRRSSGRLYCWGSDARGQLGNGITSGSPFPTAVLGGATWRGVNAGDVHTCARKTNGLLYCWGADDEGQLGDSETLADKGAPTQVAGAHPDWSRYDAGHHSCAIRTAGDLYCWGGDDDGELGDDASLLDQPVPRAVAEP